MVAALRENGVSTWYVMAKDEGHGIYKRTNRDYVFAAIALFLKQNLLK
jgi:dipeptidyl aminopeptidase/acylaminoacyl peptidase